MKITKNINGYDVELILDKIKDYDRFSIYQVSRLVNGVKTPLYKECYSDFDICEIVNNDYKLGDDEYDKKS